MRTVSTLITLLTATATAQVAVRVEAATDLRATCGVSSTFIPGGTDLTTGYTLFVQDQGYAASTITVQPGAGADFDNDVSSIAQRFYTPIATIGQHAIRVLFSAPRSTEGMIVIRISPAVDYNNGLGIRWHAEGFVDIGDDHSPDVHAGPNARTFEETVTLGATPLPVLVAVQNSAVAGSATMNVSVRFLPTGSRLARSGPACGPTLAGSLLTDVSSSALTLGVRNSSVSPDAFLVLGLSQVVVPIPPTGCVLRTDIVAPVWVPISANGTASLRWTFGPQFAVTCYAQYIVATDIAGVSHWHTSELLAIRFP